MGRPLVATEPLIRGPQAPSVTIKPSQGPSVPIKRYLIVIKRGHVFPGGSDLYILCLRLGSVFGNRVQDPDLGPDPRRGITSGTSGSAAWTGWRHVPPPWRPLQQSHRNPLLWAAQSKNATYASIRCCSSCRCCGRGNGGGGR